MPLVQLLLLAPTAAAALVAPDAVRTAGLGVQRMSRRSVFLGAAGAVLSAPVHAARAEISFASAEVNRGAQSAKVETDPAKVKTVLQYKNVNLFGEGSAERCESGEGAACDKLAGGSELILELQKQSRDNKEKNAKQLYEQTIRNLNYGEYSSLTLSLTLTLTLTLALTLPLPLALTLTLALSRRVLRRGRQEPGAAAQRQVRSVRPRDLHEDAQGQASGSGSGSGLGSG